MGGRVAATGEEGEGVGGDTDERKTAYNAWSCE